MKPFLTFLLIAGLLLGSHIAAEAGGAHGRFNRGGPAVAVRPWAGPRVHHRPAPVFVYPYYPYHPGLNYYGAPVVVSPYTGSSYYIPPTAVATTPYFCALHLAGWMTRAGFLDHVAGTHKLYLDAAESFCPQGSEACVFPAY